MRAIILAAGLGRRLGRLTRDRTKAMVPLAGRPIIARTLDALAEAGVRQVVIVTGHAADGLRAFVGQGASAYGGLDVEYVHNPLFESTNNIYSLWLARDHLLEDDALVIESDVVFEPRLLRDVVASPHRDVAVVARYEHWMDGAVTLLDRDDHVVSLVSKEAFSREEAAKYWKTVNVYKFSRAFSQQYYLPFLEAYIASFGRSCFYEQVLAVITYLSRTALKAHRLTTERWYEIDDLQDLDIAETLFTEGRERLARVQQRHGGYWRFPELRDFCYLVNPFFPPPALEEELRARVGSLVGSYPSGQKVQALLAANLFGLDPDELVVGNGATELIRTLLPRLEGSVGIVRPTFEEYARPLAPGVERRTFTSSRPDLRVEADDLATFARGLGTLVLVNPDNPTGNFIAREPLLALCGELDRRGVTFVVDESFVDFAGEERFTLLDSSVLARFPRLIVIRSLGKSHGVAGLRLGVLASGDRERVRVLRGDLPIWNVNALAEVFLQSAVRHHAEYRDACARLGLERDRFGRALAEVGLRPLPSRANFFLCELEPPLRATELAHVLLERHGILIKDCTGKPGLEGRELVRLAVRGPRENDVLLEALRACR